MKISDYFKKIKGIKHVELYVALICIILVIIIYFICFKKNSVKEESGKSEIEYTLSQIEGVGNCEVLITYKDQSSKSDVIGAVVVCDGGDNLMVVENITIALKTLLDINSNSIKVYKIK